MKERIDALAALMAEFGVAEATLREGDESVTFRKRPKVGVRRSPVEAEEDIPVETAVYTAPVAAVAVPEPPKGTPVTSPMNGIYYAAPSPGSPPFVKEGDTVQAGQTIALIEAMKVFNEVPTPFSGTVLKIVAEPGEVVELGGTLLLIGQPM